MDIEFEVFDQFHRPPVVEEMNDGVSEVETAGYIPANKQIELLISSGERLAQYRKEMYDYQSEEEDDGALDPTRGPNFDLADASLLTRRLDDKKKSTDELVMAAHAELLAEQVNNEHASQRKPSSKVPKGSVPEGSEEGAQ